MMQLSTPIIYPPVVSDGYQLGKLPTVSVRKTMDRRDRRLCVGRVWIFLLLGVLLIVLGLVSIGVYFNIEGITSSSKYTEIMPLYINAGAILFAGLSVCLLFWKRLKFLVFVSVVVCVATGFLCGIVAALTSTHVLQPLQSFSRCRYYMSQLMCQCFSPYKRDMLSLDYSETEETKYDFEDTASCSSIETVLPQLLYTLVAVYSIVFLVCIGSAVVALLVLRTERIKRGYFEDEAYEEVYTVSGSSSVDQSDSEVEVSPEVVISPSGHSIPVATIVAKNSSSRNISTLQSDMININRNIGIPAAQNVASITSNVVSVQQQKTPIVQRSKTPAALNDLGKESLANRYRITKTPDREIPGKPRQRISKTPDREIGSRRRSSFSVSKRLSRSCDSLDSSGNGSREVVEGFGTSVSEGKKKGKLKEHRRKGKRAATVHTLDTDQLLLILNLQMRYLQETKEHQSQKDLSNTNTRRAITPQPASQKQIIPQKIRSHTPQPYQASNRNRDQLEQEFYSQVDSLNRRLQNREEIEDCGRTCGNFCRSSRISSDSSSRSAEVHSEKLRGGGAYQDFSDTDQNGNYGDCEDGAKLEHKRYLISQQMHKTAPIIHEGHNPYIHSHQFNNTSADNVHFVTYSDSMLNKEASKPKSRSSVQKYILPPQPIHRNTKNNLPPQPISRQRSADDRLPPQPIHRGSSAFHVVDRNSKSRSPSVGSDRMVESLETTPRRKTKKDYADVAIRANFQMNPSPFLLRDTPGDVNPPYQENVLNQNRNIPELQSRYRTSEILPPYSRPPSYKEYVSSCDNSVTSSLSSNPDDIYSTPRRRIQRDQNVTNQNEPDRNVSNQRPEHQISDLNRRERNYAVQGHDVGNIYGNSENFQIKQRQGHKNKSEGHSSKVQGDIEAIYSSPARSRVKQFIVPEDYYSAVDKRNKHSANENMTMELTNGNERQGQRTSRDTVYANDNVRRVSSNITYPDPVKTETPSDLHGYESAKVSKHSGFVHTFNIGAEYDHQIAPDAKYHEYEDVYDTPDSVPELPKRPTENAAHPVNSQGFNPSNSRTKSKSNKKSPNKSRAPYPVSNVQARLPNFVNSDTNSVNTQVTDSVQNVHAENVNNIPRIKLNDLNPEDIADDDVFEEASLYSSNFQVRKTCDGSSDNLPKIPQTEPDHSHHSEDHLHSKSTNETSVQGHVVDSSNEDIDSGYMKMTLPSKSMNVQPSVIQSDNESSAANHMSAHSTNENAATDNVTTDMTNDNERHVPEGIEDESRESSGEYEETGV